MFSVLISCTLYKAITSGISKLCFLFFCVPCKLLVFIYILEFVDVYWYILHK